MSTSGSGGRLSNYVTRSATADEANRDPHDFYPTPLLATQAMLKVESFDGCIWEPACGDGAISRELEKSGFSVLSSDLFGRGYGAHGVDFLKTAGPRVANIITNPPFKYAEAFVKHALALTTRKVVMLNRLSWLEGRGRYASLFRQGSSPLARVWVFSSRLHFLRSGDADRSGSGGMVAFAWYVWDHAHSGPVSLDWLPPFEKGVTT